MSLHSYISEKSQMEYSETRKLIIKNKETFNFYQDSKTFIVRNKCQLKNLSKKVKEKHKIQATNPYYTITIMNKVYNEYFMNNPEILEILKEFNSTKSLDDLKVVRTESQMKRIFALKNIAQKERKLLYDQMVYEFNPEKKYHDLKYSQELTDFLIKNKKNFLKE